MIDGVDLEKWLREHSTSVEETGPEIVFTHFTGEKSILVRRTQELSINQLPQSPMLQDFYKNYAGASIGRGMLMLAASVEGGFPLSEGYTIPDFARVKETAIGLRVSVDEQDELFMVGAGYMFFYTYNCFSDASKLRCYDRDYQDMDEDRSFLEVLQDWWQLLLDR